MNILPHKSWHVRTKKNIARVRKDEKEAAEKEQDRLKRIALAEQEARIDLLRKRAKHHRSADDQLQEDNPPTTSSNNDFQSNNNSEHVNFFSDVEAGKYISQHENAEHVKEKKEEQEKYEKQIGYLTYLGQDTNELDGKRNWYDLYPSSRRKINKDDVDEDGRKIEVSLKSKLLNDPLLVMQKYLGHEISEKPAIKKEILPSSSRVENSKIKYESVIANMSKDDGDDRKRSHKKSKKHHKEKKSKKHKKEKKSRKRRRSSTTDDDDDEVRRNLQRQKVEQLRAERLKREQIEKEKAEKLLAKLRGEPEKEKTPEKQPIRQKYNSQFCPEIARQNID